MTIRANKAKVAQAIVVSSAVDVVEFEGNRLAIPGIPTAYLALALLDACFKKRCFSLLIGVSRPTTRTLSSGNAGVTGTRLPLRQAIPVKCEVSTPSSSIRRFKVDGVRPGRNPSFLSA